MDESKNLNKHDREAPHSHLIQGLAPLIFIIIMLIDLTFQWSTQLAVFIPIYVRIILLLVFLGMAILLIQLSHKVLFHKHNTKSEPSNELISTGVLKYVRNPMYLGILLIYVAFIFFTFSLISVAVFVIVVILYNRMVNYEETILEQIFGEEYMEYKNNVPKWIPKLF